MAAPREAQAATESGGEHQDEPPRPSNLTSAIQGVERAIRDLVREEDGGERQRQEQREIEDLVAQQNMAVWAQAMFWASVVTAGLTAAGLVLIRRTLTATQNAAVYAKDAAEAAWETVKQAQLATNAANETVDVTRDIAQRQIRAYLMLVPAKHWVLHPTAAKDGRGVVGFDIKNTGQTPAMQCKALYAEEFIPRAGKTTVRFSEKLKPIPDLVTTCFPGAIGGAIRISIPISEIKARIEDGTNDLVVLARVTYQDCFGKVERYVDACGVFTFHQVPPFESEDLKAASISFSLRTAYNTAN